MGLRTRESVGAPGGGLATLSSSTETAAAFTPAALHLHAIPSLGSPGWEITLRLRKRAISSYYG